MEKWAEEIFWQGFEDGIEKRAISSREAFSIVNRSADIIKDSLKPLSASAQAIKQNPEMKQALLKKLRQASRVHAKAMKKMPMPYVFRRTPQGLRATLRPTMSTDAETLNAYLSRKSLREAFDALRKI